MKNFIQPILLFSLVLTLIIASCSLRHNGVSSESMVLPSRTAEAEDIVFVVDLSASMLAQDFQPNRIEAIKEIMRGIVTQKAMNRQLSIVVFAREATVLCPLTSDAKQLLNAIDLMQVGLLESGTAIGKGITYGLYELSKSNATKQGIIVLTDGVNAADDYSLEDVSRLATQSGVQVSSIGIGCNGTAVAPISRRASGKYIFGEVAVEIDEELLKAVGESTQGNYYRVTCNADLERLPEVNDLLMEGTPKKNNTNTTDIQQAEIDSLWQIIKIDSEKVLEKFLDEHR